MNKKGDFTKRYFVDQYNLDGDESYSDVTQVFRVDEIISDKKIKCTKISIITDCEKKTGEKIIVEAKISDEYVDSMERFNTTKEVDSAAWNSIARVVIDIILKNSGVKLSFSQYCVDCENRGVNCTFCEMKDYETPTQFKKK